MSFNEPPNLPPPGQGPNQPPSFDPPNYNPPPQGPPPASDGGFAPPTPAYGIPTQAVPATGPIDPGYGVPPPKKNTGLIVAAVIGVLALLGVGAFLLLKDDDDGDGEIAVDTTALETTVATTLAPTTVPETLPATTTTVAETTTTEATTTTVAQTDPPADDFDVVTDDTGAFSVMVPLVAEVDTTPYDIDGDLIPHVSASEDLAGYNEDYDTAGYSVFGIPMLFIPSAEEVIAAFTPDPGVCAVVTPMPDYVTSLGTTEVVVGEQCGSGTASQVTMAIDVPAYEKVMMVYIQGEASVADLLAGAELILNSVVLY
jgi:hypothetical protein